jgi:hypothetical protein
VCGAVRVCQYCACGPRVISARDPPPPCRGLEATLAARRYLVGVRGIRAGKIACLDDGLELDGESRGKPNVAWGRLLV